MGELHALGAQAPESGRGVGGDRVGAKPVDDEDDDEEEDFDDPDKGFQNDDDDDDDEEEDFGDE